MGRKKMGKTVAEVQREIKNMIYYNFLAPGQKIVYQDLARKLGVSVTPVVQALKRLERSRLVSYQPNKGYAIAELTEAAVHELYQVREALEIYIVPLVAANIQKKALSQIKAAVRQHTDTASEALDQGRLLMLRDAQFHLHIVAQAGNRTIYNILEETYEQIYLRYKPELLQPDRVRSAVKEHQAILKALSLGRAGETEALLREHIKKGKTHILENIRRQNELIATDLPAAIFGRE